MDPERPGDSKALDDGIECNTDHGASGSTSSKDNAVCKSSSSKEVLCWCDSDGLRTCQPCTIDLAQE